MSLVNIKINNVPYKVEEGTTILEAARENNITIPTLCYLKNISNSGACRVCLVEIKNVNNMAAACNYPVREGLEVFTHSKKAIESRRKSVELLLSNHNKNCLSCIRNQNCELQTLSQELHVRENAYEGSLTKSSYDSFANGIVRDTSKCVLCSRCVETCRKVQGLGILGFENRGFNTIVAPVMDKSFKDVNCMQCGQCIINCPVGALSEKESIHEVINALNNPRLHVVVQTAPAVRASLGEEFNMPIGTRVTNKMVAALRRVGFDRVYDTNFGADLTIMEEGNEFIERFTGGKVLPMLTSCSPGWINYMESEYPDIIEHVSSCKSPHMMLGAVLKSYYAKNKGIKPEDIYVVSIMPCTAKKDEIKRKENNTSGNVDVDAVLTTRECARLLKLYGIDLNNMPDEDFDYDLFGEYSGAGVIFGVSGGVMEAALRTVKEKLENKALEQIDFMAVRGLKGVKEATLNINGTDINIAVVSGMNNAKGLLEEIRNKTSKYHFIEVMGCPGGCINGGGQSYVSSRIKNNGVDYCKLRAKALYDEDVIQTYRKSHENPQIISLYENYLEKPGSHLAHHLLHTSYNKKEKFNIF